MLTSQDKPVVEFEGLHRFCVGCGTCSGVCPSSAIDIKEQIDLGIYLPYVNSEKCTRCDLCTKVCPGISKNYNVLNRLFFGEEPTDSDIGNYEECYIGHSTDHKIRYHSSSGGLVTSLLKLALEEDMINGALVTRMDKTNPLRPQVFIAEKPTEVLQAAKSKYCPVPTNSLLRDIQSRDGRFAVVGLPCQMAGIRKAERIIPSLRKKIVLHLGLVCSHTESFLGTEYFLSKLGVKKKDLSTIHYRGGGWPGPPLIKLNDGTELVDVNGAWNKMFASRLFTPMHCMHCRDVTNELADISFGDPWLPELEHERIGKSLVICRNEIGKEILQRALTLGKIELSKISSKEVKISQDSFLYKKRIVNAFSRISVPSKELRQSWSQTAGHASPVDYLAAMLLLFNVSMSSKRFMWSFLSKWTSIMKYVKRLQTFRIKVRAKSYNA